MKKQSKTKRRGFVMTGGGAKGLYEAGVIHAFHNTGMEFDVITGSSIGAMNSIFFAEYLLRKKSLTPGVRNDPEKTIQQMENIIRCYLHTWLLMPFEGVIDDSDKSALGSLVKDLENFKLNLSDLVTLGWWGTNPERGKLPSPAAGTAFLRVARQFQKRLGIPQLLRLIKDHRDNLSREAIRTYLNRFGMDYSLIPSARDGKPGEDRKLENMFTRKVAPLQPANLTGDMTDAILNDGKEDRLIDPNRTFKDFRNKGIDVRLTRANYRTGRLEISSYLSLEDFLRFMEKHAWRLEVADPEKMPLGSFRLQLPGNPNVIKSALASGRFPGVFAPFHFKDIYPDQQKENQFLQKFLSGDDWMADPKIQDELRKAYFAAFGSQAYEEKWQSLLARWRKPDAIRTFFPYTTDIYVDGGAIDNTPSNTAVDATREWIETEGKSRRDITLELFVVFLNTEPRIKRDVANDPLLHEVVQRTLTIQSAAVATSDAVVVDTINTFGERGDKLARSLLAVLDALEKSKDELDPEQRRILEASVREVAEEQGIVGYRGSGSEGIFKRMKKWAEDILDNKLPLYVDEIKIYPDTMPLSTLQFTERLGYRQDNGIKMITMGCYNTLWSLRAHIEKLSPGERDAQDELSLKLVRGMMGNIEWPNPDSDTEQKESRAKLDLLKDTWQCSRQECLFHAENCMHGAKMGKAVGAATK